MPVSGSAGHHPERQKFVDGSVSGQSGDVKHSMASVEKIANAGFKPTSSFDEGLRATIDYFLNK